MAEESWKTRTGVILAVMGSAVGLGNFLRFPSQAARYGGGAYLVPYLVAFLLVGFPLAWVEWGLGRRGGSGGHHSVPGIFRALTGRRGSAYAGVLGVLIPVMIFTYYTVVEAWCLGYAWDFLTGRFAAHGADSARIGAHFEACTGMGADGSAFTGPGARMLVFLLVCYAVNYFLVYKGLSRGIERFCTVAMPLLVVCALLVLARVLTLPPNPDHPGQSVARGLGYLWNPSQPGQPFWASLARFEVWLAAAGQIFFSLSIGFGLILTYASYLKADDDLALSSLTAAAGNGFCEVVLGGMIAIPAAFVFLGPAVMQNPPGTFGMGFVALPQVFNQMPAGGVFGFLFFFLLFLAALTSSISLLQPPIALLEEGLGIGRKPATAITGFLTLSGTFFVVYFSRNLLALDTIDFWMANFFIFILATLQILLFGWVLGVDPGLREIRRGAEIRLPPGLRFVLKYVSPVYLLLLFGGWCWQELPNRLRSMRTGDGPPVAWMAIGLIAVTGLFFTLVVAAANRRWDRKEGVR